MPIANFLQPVILIIDFNNIYCYIRGIKGIKLKTSISFFQDLIICCKLYFDYIGIIPSRMFHICEKPLPPSTCVTFLTLSQLHHPSPREVL